MPNPIRVLVVDDSAFMRNALSRKIEQDSRNPQLIQTVWGGGYMLAADVSRIPAEAAS